VSSDENRSTQAWRGFFGLAIVMAGIARNIELYNSAFRLAWQHIPEDQKRYDSNASRRLHDSIRRQISEGASLDVLIASVALDEFAE
jgi:hypothetical protein